MCIRDRCSSLDYNLGRIIDTLKEKGIYEDTVIIYTLSLIHICELFMTSLLKGALETDTEISFYLPCSALTGLRLSLIHI